MKVPNIFKNFRVVILIIAVILSILAISPSFNREGVAIRAVEIDSAAYLGGLRSPDKYSRPLDYEVIQYINGNKIKNEIDYFSHLNDLKPNMTLSVKTNKGLYTIVALPDYKIETTNELVEEIIEKTISETIVIDGVNKTINKTINETVYNNKTIKHFIGTQDIGLNVFKAPTNNIRKGLDLSGGVRVLLEPRSEDGEPVSSDIIERSINGLEQRLNAFGLNDVNIRQSSDLSGNHFILVEIAGLQDKEISELIASQGKFEARISNQTAFTGGKDISHVCRTADCSGIDPSTGCSRTSDGNYACRFYFTIDMTPEAARRQADLTGKLEVITDGGQQYLSDKIQLFLDDSLVDELNIGASLKGRAETRIQISGTGVGNSRDEAITDALTNMNRLQTMLETGSLPVKLDVVKIDNLSPILGEEFLRNALLTGLIAIFTVALFVFLRYRTLKVALSMIGTALCELLILLGITSLLGTNLDLAAIAGIIIVIGTSFDHQIVITDEFLRGEEQFASSWKQKIQNAFFIIMAAYFTTVVAMLPLWFAGAGMLKGFALTTIYGVSIGVFISRPAFAAILETLLKK